MKCLLLFFADEEAWMALPEHERNSARARIGVRYCAQALLCLPPGPSLAVLIAEC